MASTIWLIDRSRVADGRGFCQRARFNNYHLGPTGYGIQMKGTKIPLMTGIAGHDGLAPILEWCRDNDELIQQALQIPVPDGTEAAVPVPFSVIRAAVKAAQDKYWKTVEVRGFAYLKDDESVQEITREQNYLIEGMIWAWCIEVLPEVLRRGRVLEVEHDDTYVFDCTCGYGDGIGTQEEHEARDCQGKGLMCKPDFLLETRHTKELEYHEFKTTGADLPTFRDKWEVMIQMFAATLDAERRHGKHVQSVYIHGLIKGKREGEYNPETKKRDGTIRQQSVFCYGYRKPANPPMEAEKWQATYEWFDEFEQRTKRLGKGWEKTGVWELPDAWIEPGISKGEHWVRWIPSAARRKQLVVLGPFSRQTLMVDHFLLEASGEENRWQAGLWELYDLSVKLMAEADPAYVETCAQQNVDPWWGVVWASPEFQCAMDKLFPRSYECRRYGMRMRCQFEGLCFYQEGWADPLGSGKYIDRRPHHRMETEQAIGRGLMLPEEGAADDEEMELV